MSAFHPRVFMGGPASQNKATEMTRSLGLGPSSTRWAALISRAPSRSAGRTSGVDSVSCDFHASQARGFVVGETRKPYLSLLWGGFNGGHSQIKIMGSVWAGKVSGRQ